MKRWFTTYIAPPVLAAAIYLIILTLRVIEIDKDIEKNLETEDKPIIYTYWHGRMFFYPCYYKNRPGFKLLVSPSEDGEIIARMAYLFGYGVVRGSSYKNPRTALRKLKRVVESGFSTLLIADGSRGPFEKLQPGALMLSKLTGRPALPTTVSFSRCWRAKSWDRLMIPKPFSKAVVVYGAPVTVPKDCDSDGLEEKRKELEQTLRSITRLADNYFTES